MTRSAPPPVATDYWTVLGLAPGADAASLKRAFREQARRWHPDLNGNDPVAEERFKAVNEAYAVLGDPKRRARWEGGLDPIGSRGESADPFASGFPDFQTYLDALFGRRQARRDQAAEPGDDPDADPGAADRPLDPPARSAVDQAGRADSPRWPETATVTHAPAPPPPVQAGADLETVVELTPDQAVSGTRLELELPGGTVVECWSPPLAGDGWRLRLAGVAPGGGDHFLQLRVRTAEGLSIEGLRVLYKLDLSPPEAALGCKVVVPTLQGPVQLRVPPGSSSGRLLRLRGRGLVQSEQRGDQLVEIRITVPEQLDEAEEALYRRLAQLSDQDLVDP
ncbi:DnaJ domain-containing protein [Synechococcus sp. CS-1325]|uniref:DnaJ C-terminal domain-containing protein n=1 Tax=Synechococcus sp. CS-1325 TaxID=2847979 RepID=UPI000DB6C8AE|nr:DnaJ C-terminal domain-containing protein [Synechococcus sp. CS-1325]MCT0199397.1 DnaJ domain-containing protein [Synechococcus sp. CS-1325]PZV03009.1 MAG: molecular chaperone DnaJ [Cyanobium sp.]